MKTTLWIAVLAVALAGGLQPAAAGQSWQWPLDHHDVVRSFDPPAQPYAAGNRGIDLRGRIGDPVRAVAAGTVSYVGVIDKVPIVVVEHGRERSTYQPVAATVRTGEAVGAGQLIGVLRDSGNHCRDAVCLHLGRKVGDAYLDPLAALSARARFRLINPDGPPPAPPRGTGQWLQRPVGGPITSPYGMRTHPITGVRKLHDGTDFGVPCGTVVHAAAAGTVVARGYHPAYGNRIVIEHRDGFSTSYNHLRSQSVALGDRVQANDVVGRVGATGLATGCHLHFMVSRDGKTLNPMSLL